ncbi:hypothetical protein Q1695_001260 [Nippostrongylus brasiliensis]|nr:hypothetical protein Q1695_001260 [Nippostrongylus brasiliensis]
MSVFVAGELDMDLRSGRLSRKFTSRRPYSNLLTITEGVTLPSNTGERSIAMYSMWYKEDAIRKFFKCLKDSNLSTSC